MLASRATRLRTHTICTNHTTRRILRGESNTCLLCQVALFFFHISRHLFLSGVMKATQKGEGNLSVHATQLRGVREVLRVTQKEKPV